MRERVFADTVQVALVVRDLQASMKTYVERYGIGPWEIYEFNPDTVENMKAHGESVESSWRLALAVVGGVMWELIQPLDDHSIYAKFLAEHGEGVHHVGMIGTAFRTYTRRVRLRGSRTAAERALPWHRFRLPPYRHGHGGGNRDIQRSAPPTSSLMRAIPDLV
ncbi:MAG TPA: VOC family protein [Gaiellaceae bacterium]|nr:VOC family protein [Gaiellaceae bacterium]